MRGTSFAAGMSARRRNRKPPMIGASRIMAKGEVNRNLLFGLLALQNGMVDQSDLVAAFRGWVRDKNQSLAAYLIERGQLEGDCKSALDALVELYEKDLGQNVEREVAATLGRHDCLRDELERSIDPDAQSLVSFLASMAFPAVDRLRGTTLDASDATKSHNPETAARSDGRFRILRFHAEGALGAIYVARDEELNRDVALKRMKDEPACDPNCRVRFVREAEITGRLEHPGIVPVYGLCQYPDGRPEYAMRFIEGESLRAAIARHHSSGSRLGRGCRTFAAEPREEVPGCLQRDVVCPPSGRRASRHQTVEYHAGTVW